MRMTGKKWQGLLCAGALTLAAAAAQAQYAGLIVTEVILTPTENEMIEISNVSASPIDISGVTVSDEDNSNTEGACKFPAGTIIAPDEAIIVAVSNSATEPTFLDTLPGTVRVFVEPARSFAGWTAANGNTIALMDDFVAAGGGTSGSIGLANGNENAFLLQPSAVFANGVGPTDLTLTIDGANMGGSPWAPINPTGQLDDGTTQGGVPGFGSSLQRTNSGTNTGTNSFFTVATADATTIGINPFAPVVGPNIIADFTGFSDDFGSVLVGSASTPSQTFTVSGDNLTDPVSLLVSGVGFEISTDNSTWVTFLNLPVAGGDVTGEPVTIYSRFNPASNDFLTDILDISSNGATSVTRNLSGAAYTTTGTYAGLVVSEVVSQPDADEYVEIYNSTGAPMDISGVFITDEDNSNTEGAATFPAGTILAAGEVVMVAANTDAAEPSWLDNLPANTRVFVEPDRVASSAAWTTVNGVTLTGLDDVISVASTINISSGDGIALHAPGTVFGVGIGATPLNFTIDGMNFNNTDTGGRTPINNGGSRESQATRVGTAQPGVGQSYARIDTAVNTDSSARYQLQTQNPGVFGAPTDDPNAGAPFSADFVSPFSGTVDVDIAINNSGTSNALNVTGAIITGPDAGKFSIIGGLPTGIAPGNSGNITVRYTPGVIGGDTATLEVSSNDTSADVVTTTLNGFGITEIDYSSPVSIELVVSEADIMAHTGQDAASVDLRAIALDNLGRIYTYTASKSSGTDADTTNPALVRIDVSGPSPVFTTIATRAELAAACNIADATSMAFNGISVANDGTVYFSQFGGVDDVVKLVPGSPNVLTNMFEGDGLSFSTFDNPRTRLIVCRINDFGGPFGGSNFFSLDLTNLAGPWTEDVIASEAEIVAGSGAALGESGVILAAHMSDDSFLMFDELFREGSDKMLRLVENGLPTPPTITTALDVDEVGPTAAGEGFEAMTRAANDTVFAWNEFPTPDNTAVSEALFIYPTPLSPITRFTLTDAQINTALGTTGNRDVSTGGIAVRDVSPTTQVVYIQDDNLDGIYAVTYSVPAAGLEGDADGDSTINAGDVTAIYNHLNGIELLTGQNLTNAATIAPADGTLDAADATALVDFLVNGTPLP